MNPTLGAPAYFDTGPGHFALNMALDEALLAAMSRLNRPILRFYGWTEPAASFGYFQKYNEVERLTPLRPLVRRPTGGGIVPHDADWTYTLVWPAGHPWHALAAVESYRRVHEWVQAAFSSLAINTTLAPKAVQSGPGQCFVGFERFDLLCEGRKIAGAAQRRTRHGLLIQGSVQPPLPGIKRTHWQQAMVGVAGDLHGVNWSEFVPDSVLLAHAAELAEQKYARPSYNRKR